MKLVGTSRVQYGHAAMVAVASQPALPPAPRGQVGKAGVLPGLIPLCAPTLLTGLAIFRAPIFSQKVHVAGEFFRSFQIRT